jgi:Flp pilus assembly pilin Flp
VKNLLQKIHQDESGQALSEYALLIALIAIVATAAVISLREEIIRAFEDLSNNLRAR